MDFHGSVPAYEGFKKLTYLASKLQVKREPEDIEELSDNIMNDVPLELDIVTIDVQQLDKMDDIQAKCEYDTDSMDSNKMKGDKDRTKVRRMANILHNHLVKPTRTKF